jgi:HPt (histidine-containing phosphotransfer) domain-containing protein
MNDDDPIPVRIDPRLAEIVPKFLERCGQTVAEIRDAVRSGDLAVARAAGHALHGSAGSFGFEAMAGIGRDIEQAARNGDTAALHRLVEALDKHVSRVRPVFE